ncbi:putative 2-hydroxyacid dehydrogenase YoaD [Peptococcaceae bacterium CEB3]|nr:putative 2-hydroxyacid dehydrogenase YoaD [Peptococcaceae bacterium CEB3]
MKIAVIGDKFVKNKIFNQVLRNHLNWIEDLSFSGYQLDWPSTPLENGGEVREYVGNDDAVASLAAEADILVTNVAPITEKVINASARLKVIGCCRGGVVNVNVTAATRKGIPVLYTPGRNAPVVAEFTVGLILSEVLNIARAHARLMQRQWSGQFYVYEDSGFELENKVAGIIGLGAIGQRVAKLLRAVGMSILAYDPFVADDIFDECGAKSVSLDELLKMSDVVSLHARETVDTHNMISGEKIRLMKPTAYLINTARGGLLDYDALRHALKSKVIAGAALDVFATEPLPQEDPLYDLDNITITPHIGGSSKETAYRSVAILAADIRRYLLGLSVAHCKNPEVLHTAFDKKDVLGLREG